MSDFQDKRIVVTGAASGIGAKTAEVLIARGAHVIGVDRHEPLAEISEFVRLDLLDPAAIDVFCARLSGKIDGLANIAGVPPTWPAHEVLQINLLALRRLTLTLVPKMADGCSIVNLASLAGFRWQHNIAAIQASRSLQFNQAEEFCSEHGLDGVRSYFLSKEALIVWTMQNRWTWRERGIRINCVSPGPVDTPILGDFLSAFGEKVAQDIRSLDRVATSNDIAPVVAFLLSEQSRWMRGCNVPVDGGSYANILCTAQGV